MANSLYFLEAFQSASPDIVLLFGNSIAPTGGIECEALDILSGGFVHAQVRAGRFGGQEDESLLLHADGALPQRFLWVGLGEPLKYWLDWADRCAERLAAWAGGLRLGHLLLLPPAFVNADQADYRGWGKKWEPKFRGFDWLTRITVAADRESVEAYVR